jgi:hypothetical protein
MEFYYLFFKSEEPLERIGLVDKLKTIKFGEKDKVKKMSC